MALVDLFFLLFSLLSQELADFNVKDQAKGWNVSHSLNILKS